MEDRFMIRKLPEEHSQELHPKPKFFVIVKEYFIYSFVRFCSLSEFFIKIQQTKIVVQNLVVSENQKQ